MEKIVEQPTPVANIIAPTPAPVENTANTVVDGPQVNGRHLDRELSTRSAPLSEHEDVSTPNLSSKARKTPPNIIYKTTNIYQDTVLQTKGGNTQIAIGRNSPGSKNKNVKVTYNKKDADEGEDEPLLNDEDSKDELDREEAKSQSSHEASEQQSEPIKEGNGNCMVNNQTEDSLKSSQCNKAEDVSETSFSNILRNVEADSEGRPVTQKLHKTQKLSAFYRRNRKMSASHESLFLDHGIEDVGKTIADEAVYKSLINTVMDQCLSYLLDNMDPVLMVDRFTVKEIFTHIIRRHIQCRRIINMPMAYVQRGPYDEIKSRFDDLLLLFSVLKRRIQAKNMPTQPKQSRMIVEKIRETGKQYYQEFKVCLWETKQQGCLNKVLEVENKVLKKNPKNIYEYSEGPNSDLDKSFEGQPDDEQTNDNNMDDAFNSMCKDSSTSSQGKSQKNVEKVDDRSELEGKTAENTFSDPSDHGQLPEHENAGPTYLPPLSDTIEQVAKTYLLELKQIMVRSMERSRHSKLKEIHAMYKEFKKKCEQIEEQFTDLTLKAVVPEQLPHDLHCKENYLNTPPEFDAYKSSGNYNSCLYQSVSLLLKGTENFQCSLRLLATLRAVESYRIYKKQLLAEMDLERLKKFFMRHINEKTWKGVCDIDDAESVTDICLQILIMETACLGTESNVLHVGFLSGALGMNIHQHFQQYSEYGVECKTVPWEKIIQDMWINSNLPDLHIFWVNYNKTAKGIMNHIVPLKPKAIS